MLLPVQTGCCLELDIFKFLLKVAMVENKFPLDIFSIFFPSSWSQHKTIKSLLSFTREKFFTVGLTALPSKRASNAFSQRGYLSRPLLNILRWVVRHDCGFLQAELQLQTLSHCIKSLSVWGTGTLVVAVTDGLLGVECIPVTDPVISVKNFSRSSFEFTNTDSLAEHQLGNGNGE